MAYQKSRDELKRGLNIQAAALRSSCDAFDRGQEWEAVRIAAATSILCHDKGRAVSILTQLKVKNELEFLSVARKPYANNLAVTHSLVLISWGPNGIRYEAVRDRDTLAPIRSNFQRWWKQEIIAAGPMMAWTLTREDLIASLRDQDGGGHFDAGLTNEAYVNFSRTAHWIVERSDHPPENLMGLEAHSVRQIGWELLRALETGGYLG